MLKYKKQIIFFATKNTIKYNKKIKYYCNNKKLIPVYIKDLPKLIDKKINNLNDILPILKKGFKPYSKRYINSIVLGCTHFKLIKKQLLQIFNNKIHFYEYEKEIALNVKQYADYTIKNSSFIVELSGYDYPAYISIKNYLLQHVNS